MPALSDHPSLVSTKLLVAADSGSGKTGGLASLVDAGHKLFILDFDRGTSTIRGYVKDKAKLATNIAYIPFADRLKLKAKMIGIEKADAFKAAMDVLESGSPDWGINNPGPLETWPAEHVLVVDTFSTMGRMTLAHVMQLDGKGYSTPEIQHYGVAMENLERFLSIITSEAVRASVIVNTHLQFEEKVGKVWPEALGSKLGPKVPRYFDNMITIGLKLGERQYHVTKNQGFVCKTSIPLPKETYPLSTGLADIFQALQKG